MNIRNALQYIQGCLKIKDKGGKIVPFVLNEPQRKLYAVIKRQAEAGKPIRVIILKARQMGFSTLTEALLFHRTATRANTGSMIVTHKDEATTNLFNMSKLYYEELPNPIKPMLKTSNAKELIFENPTRDAVQKKARPGLRSKIKCATAGGSGVGRSDTLQNVHASEFAFWPGDKVATLAGLLQAVPPVAGTMVIIESTANGFDAFKDMWDAAVAGESDFEPVFFAWYELDGYRMPYDGAPLTAEERELQAAYNLDLDQIQWRRWCIANNCGGDLNLFHQEYPATPEEAFIATGTTVFDKAAIVARLEAIRKEGRTPERGRFEYATYYDPDFDAVMISDSSIRWVEDERGAIEIYKQPDSLRPYVIGGDTAGEGSDYFAAHVLDNTTGEQAARLHGRMDEDVFSAQAYCLGMYYGRALLGIEANFSSYPVRKLAEWRYPRQFIRRREDAITHKPQESYGFRTTSSTRPLIIAGMVAEMRDNIGRVNDPETLREMLVFVKNDRGRPEAMAGEHDDLVMSYAIAVYLRQYQDYQDAPPPPKPKTKLPFALQTEGDD